MDITVVDLTINGMTANLLDQVDENPLQPGDRTTVEPEIVINVCQGGSFEARINVEAESPRGESCQAENERT